MKENILLKANGINLILNGIFTLIIIFYFLPVGFHMAYTGIKAFKEYGFKKLPKKYTVFYMGKINYALELISIGVFYFIVSIWCLFFKDGGYLFLWVEYLLEILNTYFCGFVR